MVGSECYNHHSIQCEVEKAHEIEVVEPEELVRPPAESHHSIEDKTVNKSLDCDVNGLYGHLHGIEVCMISLRL